MTIGASNLGPCTDNSLCQVFADKTASAGILVEVGSIQLCQMLQGALEILLVLPLCLWVEHFCWHLTDRCGHLQKRIRRVRITQLQTQVPKRQHQQSLKTLQQQTCELHQAVFRLAVARPYPEVKGGGPLVFTPIELSRVDGIDDRPGVLELEP